MVENAVVDFVVGDGVFLGNSNIVKSIQRQDRGKGSMDTGKVSQAVNRMVPKATSAVGTQVRDGISRTS